MFSKATGGFRQAKRAVLEKAGKAEATQEGPEFQGKVRSLQSTQREFQYLHKIGVSIFKNTGDDSKNPADDFTTTIKETLKLKKQYDRSRLAMDTAKQTAHS